MKNHNKATPAPPSLTRRSFLGSTTAALAGGYGLLRPPAAFANAGSARAGTFGELDATVEGGIDLYLDRQPVAIAGGVADAITVNGLTPGPVICMTEGHEALIRVHNRMDEDSSIHWHGILLPYTMDGVPGISFAGIQSGTTFIYRFRLRQNGTYWYHSHSGMQEQLGLFGQIIVKPASVDPVSYDVEHTVVLSDWSFENPHAIMRNLKTMEGYYNFQRPTVANLNEQVEYSAAESIAAALKMRLAWQRMRMDPTDLADVTGATYAFLMNGRTAEENPTLLAEPGQRVRLRILNASAVTFYDFCIPGVPLTVVQADGQNVEPVETDELRIAIAETYDVILTMPDHPVTLFAEAMDRSGYARGTLASGTGQSAEVPEQRMRPMLTMMDMGMDHAMGEGMSGDSMNGGGDMHHDSTSTMDPTAMAHGSMESAPTNQHDAESTELPVAGLPERVMHGPDGHGPGSISMGMFAFRRTAEPGVGLGDDNRRVLTYQQLLCLETPADRRPPTRQFDLHLTGNMHKYIWGMDGKKWSESDVIKFQYGERLRLNFINDTMMTHPMHLHGMWMDLYTGGDYARCPRKHTVRVKPSELLTVDISADAPGQWAFHCHVMYHMEMGMFRTVAVVRSLDEEPIHADA